MFRRDMSQRNKQAFCDSMYGINWETVVDMTNAQQAISAFHSEILRLYNTHFPKRNVKVNSLRPSGAYMRQ